MGNREFHEVFSTYASEIISLTAADACIDILENGAYDQFRRASTILFHELSDIADDYGSVVGEPTFFQLSLSDIIDKSQLCRRLYGLGVLYHPLDQVLVSAAHTDRDLEQVVNAFRIALHEQCS